MTVAPPGDVDAVAGADAPILPEGPAAKKRRGLGGAFVKGMIWSTLALIVSKFSSLLATLALSWIFGGREYWSFSAARSASMIGDIFTDGGMRRVLITRGDEYARIARTAFRISLGFNLLGCLLMCAAAALTQGPGVASQLIVTAAALLIATFGSVQRARLVTDMRFARTAFLYTISAVLRNGLMVLFACGGLGPLSFALPVVFVALWEAIYARHLVGPLPPDPPDLRRGELARELIGQGKWVIFAMIGSSLVARGDFFVSTQFFGPQDILDASGKVIGVSVAGLYFWAFTLTLALFSPLTIGLATVIQPVMAQLATDPKRQGAAFLRMIRIAVFLAVPASLVSIGTAPVIIHSIRHGYWDAAIVAVQILAASECVRQLYQMSIATLEAGGRWRSSAVIVIVDGLITVIAATLGCMIGGTLVSLTLAVAIGRTVTAIAQAIYTSRTLGGRARAVLMEIMPSLVMGGVIGGLLGGVVYGSSGDAFTRRWLLVGAAVLSVPLYFGLARLLTPVRFRESSDLLLSRLTRRLRSGTAAATAARRA